MLRISSSERVTSRIARVCARPKVGGPDASRIHRKRRLATYLEETLWKVLHVNAARVYHL
jgi:hypothetical protein